MSLKRRFGFLLLGCAALVVLSCIASYHGLEFSALVEIGEDSYRGSKKNSDYWTAEFDVDHFYGVLPNRIKGLVNMNADPCEDFHAFACGGWEEEIEIPSEKTSVEFAWTKDQDLTIANMHRLIENDSGPLGAYFSACMDTDLVDRLGIDPLRPYLERVDSVKNKYELSALVAELHQLHVIAFFKWKVFPDQAESSKMHLYFSRADLGLPHLSYYTVESDVNTAVKQMYLKMIQGMITLAEVDDADAAANVWEIETKLAEAAKLRDTHIDDNEPLPTWDLAKLEKDYPHMSWRAYFDRWGYTDFASKSEQITVTNRAFMSALDTLYGSATLAQMKSYVRFHVIYHLASLLPQPFLDQLLVYDHVITGKQKLTARWRKCTYSTRTSLPMMSSEAYVQEYIPEKTKIIASSMVENIRLAFGNEIEKSDWMSAKVKAEALRKLDSMAVETAYPSDWSAYVESDLFVAKDTYLENYANAMRYKSSKSWSLLRVPVDRRRWIHQPTIANAYYAAGSNAAWVPVGILQDPFFNLTLPASYNFGAVGSIIGHELTHGFDISGRKFDARGNKRLWWDKRTLDRYLDNAQCFVDLYDSFELYGFHVNGIRTLGEDVADVGGAKIAYKAWLLAVELYSPHPPTDHDRRLFWMSYASTRCGVSRKAAAINRLKEGSVHPPDQFRLVGTVTQLEEFARDFKCPVGTPMNPEKRCSLW